MARGSSYRSIARGLHPYQEHPTAVRLKRLKKLPRHHPDRTAFAREWKTQLGSLRAGEAKRKAAEAERVKTSQAKRAKAAKRPKATLSASQRKDKTYNNFHKGFNDIIKHFPKL